MITHANSSNHVAIQNHVLDWSTIRRAAYFGLCPRHSTHVTPCYFCFWNGQFTEWVTCNHYTWRSLQGLFGSHFSHSFFSFFAFPPRSLHSPYSNFTHQYISFPRSVASFATISHQRIKMTRIFLPPKRRCVRSTAFVMTCVMYLFKYCSAVVAIAQLWLGEALYHALSHTFRQPRAIRLKNSRNLCRKSLYRLQSIATCYRSTHYIS